MKILVTGATGLLGSACFCSSELFPNGEVVGTYHQKTHADYFHLDLCSTDGPARLLDKINPDIVIHTAAAVNVKFCEENREAAVAINVTATAHIAKWCEENKSRLIFISSDYVFSGQKDNYSEDDPVDPLNWYGRTKAMGEEAVLREGQNVVVRVALLYKICAPVARPTFIQEVQTALEQQSTVKVDDRRVKFPVEVTEVALALSGLLNSGIKGVVHFASEKPITRCEWARQIAGHYGYKSGCVVPLDAVPDSLLPVRVKLLNNRFASEFSGTKDLLNRLG